MTFHKRFQVPISKEEAEKRFIRRMYNLIFEAFYKTLDGSLQKDIKFNVATAYGHSFNSTYSLEHQLKNKTLVDLLHAVEIIYELVDSKQQMELEKKIDALFRFSEMDPGFRWEEGKFFQTGAESLDDALINETLRWLSDEKYSTVLEPYSKGLMHFLEADKKPKVLADVITDMHEALEAMTNIVIGPKNKRSLSGNRDSFIKKLNVSDKYKKLLSVYAEFTNTFRHAEDPEKPRPKITKTEVESLIYVTGIFLRLGIESQRTSPEPEGP